MGWVDRSLEEQVVKAPGRSDVCRQGALDHTESCADGGASEVVGDMVREVAAQRALDDRGGLPGGVEARRGHVAVEMELEQMPALSLGKTFLSAVQALQERCRIPTAGVDAASKERPPRWELVAAETGVQRALDGGELEIQRSAAIGRRQSRFVDIVWVLSDRALEVRPRAYP